MDTNDSSERSSLTTTKPLASTNLSLQDAVNLGEYQPAVLSQFPEWRKLSRHGQFQLVCQGLENRRRQLMREWADIVNFINVTNNPNLKQAGAGVFEKLRRLSQDKENLYFEYFRP